MRTFLLLHVNSEQTVSGLTAKLTGYKNISFSCQSQHFCIQLVSEHPYSQAQSQVLLCSTYAQSQAPPILTNKKTPITYITACIMQTHIRPQQM